MSSVQYLRGVVIIVVAGASLRNAQSDSKVEVTHWEDHCVLVLRVARDQLASNAGPGASELVFRSSPAGGQIATFRIERGGVHVDVVAELPKGPDNKTARPVWVEKHTLAESTHHVAANYGNVRIEAFGEDLKEVTQAPKYFEQIFDHCFDCAFCSASGAAYYLPAATELFAHSDYRGAIDLARNAQGSPQARWIIAISSCRLGDAVGAREALKMLLPDQRRSAIEACARKGVNVP